MNKKQTIQKRILGVLLLVAVPLCAHSGWVGWKYYQASQLRLEGDLLEHQHQSARALAAYRRCLELYPYFMDVHQEMAEIYMDQKDWSNALLCLNAAVRDCPNNPLDQAIVYRQRGHCCMRAGQLKPAREDLQTALRLDPEESLARRLLEEVDSNPKLNSKPNPVN